MELKLCAVWTNDCQGKKDYDGDIVSVSTRYWPRGGGFWSLNVDASGVTELPQDNSIRPSASSQLVIWHGRPGWDEKVTLAKKTFEAETFEEVSQQVEAWAQEQMDRVTTLLLAEFGVTCEFAETTR